jgi:hypothetical protein
LTEASSVISMPTPAASAPATKQLRTRGHSRSTSSSESARIMHSTVAAPGMTLTAVPASLTQVCTRSASRFCWRSNPIATCATVTASAALSASNGREACAVRPW